MPISKEAKTGLMVAISVVVIILGSYFLKGFNLFSSDKTYNCYFDNVQGLIPSATVQVKGMVVGTVSEVVWKHGLTAIEAKAMVMREIEALGHQDRARWEGNRVTATIGWGVGLDISAVVKDDVIEIEHCSGALSGVVLPRCQELLERTFPGGRK